MYLTFDEYKELGGMVTDSSTFLYLLADAEACVNYYTHNRLSNFSDIPLAVKNLLVRLIDLNQKDYSCSSAPLASYSNGIESFSYDNSTGFSCKEEKTKNIIKQYLSAYPELLYRGIKY